LLSDLAAIEQRIARSSQESATDAAMDWGEKRYQHLVENSLGLICTHDMDGVVLSVNPAAANSLGYEPHDGIGRNLREFLSPNTRGRFDFYLKRIRDHGHDSGVMRVVRKDGTERMWLYRNVLYTEPGAHPYVLGHAIDVTERAAAEAELRKSQEQTLHATSRLAGRVAHAFNNLLTVVIGSAEMLMADPPTDRVARGHLEAILRAASRGATVAQQLLAVGGQQPIDRAVLDLNELIESLQGSLRRVAGPHVTVVFNLEPSLPNIEGDSVQIEQVLLHLAGNAGDATAEGGVVMIETSSTISEEVRTRGHQGADPEQAVWLTVRDTGSGMDAQTRNRVFEPFFTTKSPGLSTGLGLPVVYGIVHQLGGTIAVDSELGRGTSFTIALRRAPASLDVTRVTPLTVPPQPGAATILLVDDEEDVRSVMLSMLRQKGYRVLDAGSGAEAIRILEAHGGAIDMLVTDVLMPGMSGRELYEHLARRLPGLKVLFVSGYADDAFGRQPGLGHSFLSKPFLMTTFTKRVHEVLHRS
jgi:PAS domain S-box-containing protein